MLLKKTYSPKGDYSFLIKFIMSFSLLYLFFPMYRGITGEGGRMYVALLDTHFNIINGFTDFLTSSAGYLLGIFDYNVIQNDYRTLRINSSPGVIVNPSCLGWGVMSFWVAFVYANRGGVLRKFKWVLIGLAAIISLNISRIALITLSNYLHWSAVTSLDHHLTFNVASYLCIIALIFLYLKNQINFEEPVSRSIDLKQQVTVL